VIELQAKWVARVLSGKILLPTEEEMMESVKDIYRFMEENALHKRHTHSIRPFQVRTLVFLSSLYISFDNFAQLIIHFRLTTKVG
jgi:hypothetical protein